MVFFCIYRLKFYLVIIREVESYIWIICREWDFGGFGFKLDVFFKFYFLRFREYVEEEVERLKGVEGMDYF